MPIHCPLPLRPIPQAAFNEIDAVVMRHSYAAQNGFGRLCDERVYENDVAARLRTMGITDVHTQVPVIIEHKGFTKVYRLDLVVNHMVYELKAVDALSAEHEAQAIHYAVMLGIDRVKLINFGSPKVIGRLLRSPFAKVNRRHFTVSRNRWQPLSESCNSLLSDIVDLLTDVGTFLETTLYVEAMTHLYNGEGLGIQRLPVIRNGLTVGTHKALCHAPDVGFVITAFTEETGYGMNLARLLPFIPLRGIQWLNLNHTELQVTTLKSANR